MVLNDVFDREQDARERPTRPIPSGRISIGRAAAIGWTLIGRRRRAGLVGRRGGAATGGPGVVATLLAATVSGYDAVLKRTPLGPLAMGACRTLNVLLGMSVS